MMIESLEESRPLIYPDGMSVLPGSSIMTQFQWVAFVE